MMDFTAPLNSILPESEVALLERRASFRRVTAGEVLVRLRSSDRSLLVVISGAVAVKRPTQDPLVLDAAGGPIVIGELALLSLKLSRTATVTAVTDGLVMELPSSVYEHLKPQLPQLEKLLHEQARTRLQAIQAARFESDRRAYEQYRAYLDALERVR
jgi:CRP-like cAMP-binding protein